MSDKLHSSPLTEQEAFFAEAARAIYLKGWLVAKLEMDPDTTTAKQIESKIVELLDFHDNAFGRFSELQREITRLRAIVEPGSGPAVPAP